MNFRPQKRARTFEISVLNLIDVMFNVVIFLLLTTTFSEDAGLGIELPKSKSRMETRAERLVVAVTADGQAHFEGQDVTPEELEAALKSALAQREDKNVVVRGDESAPHGKMMGVYDAVRSAGGTGISVGAVSPEAARPSAAPDAATP